MENTILWKGPIKGLIFQEKERYDTNLVMFSLSRENNRVST